MGTIAARKAREIVRNAENVLAIELLCGAQAMDLFTNMKPGEGTWKAYELIRQSVSHLEQDRLLAKDIETVRALMDSGRIIEAVESVTGPLR